MYINQFDILRTATFALATIMLLKYYVFLILGAFYPLQETWRKIRTTKIRQRSKERYQPLVSVIIPAWNEEVGILRTVESLLKNTYQPLEIIVVNDGSTDRTERVVQKYIERYAAKAHAAGKSLKYFYQPNSGKGTALNHGIENATGEIIMTMDADSVVERQAIERLVAYFEDPNIDAVVGNVKVADNSTFIGMLQKLEYYFGFYFKRAHSVMGAEYIFGGACAAFRRSETFDKYGLFDTHNKTEDIEMSMRLRAYGIQCAYAEDVICYTEGASSISGLINQRLRWKKGRFDTFIKYRNLFLSPQSQHNKFMAWFVLPYSLLGEIQLFFEPIAISLLLTYSFVSGDYFSLLFGALFMSTVYYINALFNHNINLYDRFMLIPLFFFTWGLFYVLVWVEYLALIKSIFMLIRGNNVTWQNWERKGVIARI